MKSQTHTQTHSIYRPNFFFNFRAQPDYTQIYGKQTYQQIMWYLYPFVWPLDPIHQSLSFHRFLIHYIRIIFHQLELRHLLSKKKKRRKIRKKIFLLLLVTISLSPKNILLLLWKPVHNNRRKYSWHVRLSKKESERARDIPVN